MGNEGDDRKSWAYAFLIMLLLSGLMLGLRLASLSFLALDFELLVIYVPTLIAAVVYVYVARLARKSVLRQG